jgi:hypothetical protein
MAIGADAITIQKFDTSRKKRNIADYERAGGISNLEVDDMHLLAQRLPTEPRLGFGRTTPSMLLRIGHAPRSTPTASLSSPPS